MSGQTQDGSSQRSTHHSAGRQLVGKVSAALSTSLNRLRIKYVVTVKQLTEVDIAGLAHVRADAITTDRLRVKFGGLGDVRLSKLNARRLAIDVTMPGPCEIEVAGRVEEQHVSLNGMGEYDARGLESRIATVDLKGGSLGIAVAAPYLGVP